MYHPLLEYCFCIQMLPRRVAVLVCGIKKIKSTVIREANLVR